MVRNSGAYGVEPLSSPFHLCSCGCSSEFWLLSGFWFHSNASHYWMLSRIALLSWDKPRNHPYSVVRNPSWSGFLCSDRCWSWELTVILRCLVTKSQPLIIQKQEMTSVTTIVKIVFKDLFKGIQAMPTAWTHHSTVWCVLVLACFYSS